MGTAISPKHAVFDKYPYEKWPLDLKIDVFLARIDGWHLEVADRCINGWENTDGEQCVNAPLRDEIVYYFPDLGWVPAPNREGVTHQIPDSGWAVLQMVLNYFEIIGRFKFFVKSDIDKDYLLFKRGVFDVFPEYKKHQEKIAEILWSHLRGGLYHSGIRSGKVFLQHVEPPKAISYDDKNGRLEVDPHEFVKKLRQHLAEYVTRLKDPNETNLRAKFDAAFQDYYISNANRYR